MIICYGILRKLTQHVTFLLDIRPLGQVEMSRVYLLYILMTNKDLWTLQYILVMSSLSFCLSHLWQSTFYPFYQNLVLRWYYGSHKVLLSLSGMCGGGGYEEGSCKPVKNKVQERSRPQIHTPFIAHPATSQHLTDVVGQRGGWSGHTEYQAWKDNLERMLSSQLQHCCNTKCQGKHY